jgi:hypothetical protein
MLLDPPLPSDLALPHAMKRQLKALMGFRHYLEIYLLALDGLEKQAYRQ